MAWELTQFPSARQILCCGRDFPRASACVSGGEGRVGGGSGVPGVKFSPALDPREE